MISISKFIKTLEEILSGMDRLKVRKVLSVSLHKSGKNYYKINKSSLQELLEKARGIGKRNIVITDLPNNEARFVFKDLTEGKVIIDSQHNKIILGARI
ncbi:hypothetical protein [Fusobacterium russii]|uniref:hypothetical protein n=1 Tax=Fusobacterium russii TaxID=854 RepID=UPI0003A5CA98|nr:hypothetical protein [Fusobacterium russii]